MENRQSFAIHSFHSLLSALNENVTIVDAEGTVVYWNQGAEKMYGINPSEIIGKNIREFFQVENNMNLKVLVTEQPVWESYHQPGHGKHALITTLPIYNDKKELLGSVSVEKDITSTIKLNDELFSKSKELQQLKKKVNHNHYKDPFSKIIGNSQAIKHAIQLAKRGADSNATILIQGESGVGKEIFAQSIHEESMRWEKPFIPVNCGAIPQALFESELFGYEKGAFTGADSKGRKGKMELADGGTLFLDEVGELPLDMQVKLLRVLQEKVIYRLGGQNAKKIDIRIIAATNRDLEFMLKDGTFRSDLFYRLNVFNIHIPNLNERLDDVTNLASYFLKELSFKYSKSIPDIHPEVLNILTHYHWPGNIRELQNIMERLLILYEGGEVTESDIKALLPNTVVPTVPKNANFPSYTFTEEKNKLEKTQIIKALQITYGNKSIAAKKLGISRSTLYSKIKKYEIDT